MAGLRDDDAALSHETTGGGAGGLHERLPCGAIFASDGASRLGGADGFVVASIGEELQDGVFELLVLA